MVIRKRRGSAGITAVATLAVLCIAYGSASAGELSSQEQKCGKALGKVGANLAKTIASAMARCRADDISGDVVGSCPNQTAQDAIDKSLGKLETSIDGSCASQCKVSSTLACIESASCPPLPPNSHESCSGATGTNKFSIKNLKYPGPYCEAIVGHKLTIPAEVSTCVTSLTNSSTLELVDVIYGSLTNATAPSPGAQSCLAAISKAAQKLSNTIYKSAAKCRNSIYAGKSIADPATCRYADTKLVAKVDKSEQKLADAVDTKCTDPQIVELDLCKNGVGGTLDKTEATNCLIAAVNEITDSNSLPVNRQYSPISIVNGAYPPVRGVCGDNLVNQVPSNFAVLGEECDGTDDSACPGQCISPGNLYECTCATRPLVRFVADGLTADLDSGWTGTSHEQGVADRAGYVNELHNCNCAGYTNATCTGGSSDSLCDVTGFQLPTCSWDPLSLTRCDDHGNNDNTDAEIDCNKCDEFTLNPGTWCQNDGACTSQCYDSNNVAQGTCTQQSDCPSGQRCRGQCETTNPCIILTNGAPLPISSGGTAVCILTKFRENVIGTRDIVTGEHAVYVSQFSVVHLGVTNSVPCPVCGGFCSGGPQAGEVCEGTCSTTTSTKCRFDTDCPSGETCTTTSSDCPGSTCNLSLVCGGGTNPTGSSLTYGEPCRLEAVTTQFGTTSSDCLPITGKNISGDGLEVNFFPSTSEAVDLPAVMACNAPGFELFDCPCSSGFGAQKRPTQPNLCAGACDTGVNAGQGCATGAGNISGDFTTCDGGDNDGRACDQDSDCAAGGGTCSSNPTHCEGGAPADELKPCATNAECSGGGACVDACPGGRCLPLCLPNEAGEPDEGYCAAGPNFYHCSGADDTFRTCSASIESASCAAVCATTCTAGVPSGGSATPCDGTGSCPVGESCCGSCTHAQTCGAGDDGLLGTSDDVPGAGVCVADIRHCYVNDLATEGGDMLNGNGDPTNVRTVTTYCIAPTSNGAVNQTAGLGGPGRLRQNGVNVSNGVLP